MRTVAYSLAFLLLAVVATSAVVLPGIPQIFTADDEVLSAISDDVAQKLEAEYMTYLKTGVETSTLRHISRELSEMHSKKDLFTKEVEELGAADQFFMCTTCRATVNVVARMFRDDDGELNGPNNEKIMKDITLDLCARLNIQTQEVCDGLFDSNWPTILYIIQNTEELDGRTFCSLFMEKSFCNVQSSNYTWSMDIDNSVQISAPKSEKPMKAADDFHILHLTDIHYDPLYVAGSNAECDEPLCCQKGTGESTKAAGYWGDYRECDAPEQLLDNAFQHIKENHPNIKYIYDTGDRIDHMVWGTSIEKNNDVLTKISDKLYNTFGANVKVFPCIGNHEPHPLNV